jgi:hypothetical protein
MTEIQKFKTSREWLFAGFEHSDFEFVSDFVLRISDLVQPRAQRKAATF